MKNKNVTITFTPVQYKLLIDFLECLEDSRSSCGCNDVYKNELELFSVDELKVILESNGKSYAKQVYKEWKADKLDETWEEALKSGWGFCDTSFINYLISTIKKQAKQSK